MAFTVDSLIRIVAAGGGLIIDCHGYTLDSLIRIAAASSASGAKVILTNTAGFAVDSLIRIGAASNGNIVIDTRPLQ